MRILHTSDWHVGKTIRGRSRADEHRAVLGEIAGIARDREVDVVLVGGDLFDTAAPGPESERIVYRALLDLADTGAEVVVVAGNHDNPRRLTAVKPLLDLTNVHTAPTLARPDDGGVIDLETRSGETARIALLPFLSQRSIVRADDLMSLDADQHAGSYAARMRQIVGALAAGFGDDAVNLVLGHLTVASGQPVMGGGERAAHTIFDYVVPPNVFPTSAQYVALGHLHRVHRIPGPCPIWYPGSPLHLDFGEAPGRKAVLLVEASPGLPAKVEEVALTAGRRLRTVRGTLAQLEAMTGDVGDDYLRVVVEEATRIGLADEVRHLLPHAVDVSVAHPDEDRDDDRDDWDLDAFHRSPVELFEDYLAANDTEDPALVTLFHDLLEEAHAPEQA